MNLKSKEKENAQSVSFVKAASNGGHCCSYFKGLVNIKCIAIPLSFIYKLHPPTLGITHTQCTPTHTHNE